MKYIISFANEEQKVEVNYVVDTEDMRETTDWQRFIQLGMRAVKDRI